jgi:APA family basic amino acid/polyamine antiporter
VVPILGVATCLFMMVFLPLDTWIRLIVWMMIGIDVYLFYGMKNSILNKAAFTGKSYSTVAFTGLGLAVLLFIVALLHHSDPIADDTSIFYFSVAFAALHLLIYIAVSAKKRKALN